LQTLGGHEGEVTAMSFSADGGLLASVCHQPDPFVEGVPPVRIWNPRTGELIRTVAMPVVPRCVAFAPRGRVLACALERNVQLWNAETGELVQQLSGHRGPVTALGFTPDGTRLISGSHDCSLLVWDVSEFTR
jgi:WD40 repeat protein